jgi:hypothetical protein
METEIITPQTAQRMIAELLRSAGSGEIWADSLGKKVSQSAYFSLMLWDAVTEGMLRFSDGRTLVIDNVADWVQIVKFLSVHIDGPATQGNTFNNINLYKVYNGIDINRV